MINRKIKLKNKYSVQDCRWRLIKTTIIQNQSYKLVEKNISALAVLCPDEGSQAWTAANEMQTRRVSSCAQAIRPPSHTVRTSFCAKSRSYTCGGTRAGSRGSSRCRGPGWWLHCCNRADRQCSTPASANCRSMPTRYCLQAATRSSRCRWPSRNRRGLRSRWTVECWSWWSLPSSVRTDAADGTAPSRWETRCRHSLHIRIEALLYSISFRKILKQAVYFINSASDISVYVLYSCPANYFLFASFPSLKRNLQYVYISLKKPLLINKWINHYCFISYYYCQILLSSFDDRILRVQIIEWVWIWQIT